MPVEKINIYIGTPSTLVLYDQDLGRVRSITSS